MDFPHLLPLLCPPHSPPPQVFSAVFLQAGSPSSSDLHTASKIISATCKSAHASLVLKTYLWLPPCPRDHLQFNSQALSTAVRSLPYWTLCIHPSSVILIFCSSVPKAFQTGKRTSSIFLISSLECSSAPLPTPNPMDHSRLILGFTPPGAKLLSSKLSWVFPQGSLSTWCWSLLKLIIGCLPLIFSMLGWKL